MTATTPPALPTETTETSDPEALDLAPSDDPASTRLTPESASTTRPLPADTLPCADCGTPAAGPEVERAHPTRVAQTGPNGGRDRPVWDSDARTLDRLRFTRCDTCAARDVHAARLTGALAGRLGALGREPAADVAAAVRALAVVGVDVSRTPLLPSPAAAEADPVAAARQVIALARRLAHAGHAARWARRYAPMLEVGAQPDTAAAEPWSHTLPELRATIREHVARLLAAHVARRAPDREVRPPAPDPFDVPRGAVVLADGCAVCGVRAVSVPASRVTAHPLGLDGLALEVWTLRTFSADALGVRRPQGRRVTAYTCPPCSDALAAVGSVGPTAFARCLAAAVLPAATTSPVLADVAGATPWAADVLAARDHHRPPPSPAAPTAPFAHLGSRERLADMLGTVTGTSPTLSTNGGR